MMKITKLYILFYIFTTTFTSCDPASSIDVTNKTNYKLYIEYEFEDFEINHHREPRINNNFIINSGENVSIIYLFQETSIIRKLGFGEIKNKNDISNAVDMIFKNIYVYKILNEKNELLYDKTYFLDNKNIIWHKYPVSYSIEFLITNNDH